MAETMAFDAVVVAGGEHAGTVVAGLSLRERGLRVARASGAARIKLLRTASDADGLAAWFMATETPGLLILSAAEQVVHPPLVRALLDDTGEVRMAIDQGGAYAGALLAHGPHAKRLAEGLESERGDDRAVAAAVMNEAVTQQVRHGSLARHPARTRGEAKAAARMLEGVLNKPQDNWITRTLYRPVSRPLTRLLLPTPITPNQISVAVALLAIVGCVLTARASYGAVILGTALILSSSYLDCCDGEIARLRLEGSRFGAWLDTVIDELSQLGYMAALGYHVYLRAGDAWISWTIGAGALAYLGAIYIIYYNLIWVVGSANSQDYAAGFEVIEAGAHQVRLAPVAAAADERAGSKAIRVIVALAPMLIRRDFISWAVLLFAIAHLTTVSYALLVIGGLVTAAIVLPDHLRLRAARRRIRRQGQVLLRP